MKSSRRRSISNLQEYSGLDVLEKHYLQIDVEIAYQLVLMREKQSSMINAIKVLEVSSVNHWMTRRSENDLA